jgi:ligand-binding sensor domain-containing protein/signal transduction histidine kinase
VPLPLPRFGRALAIAVVWLLAGASTQALDGTRPLGRYVHRVWNTDDGLPQNAVYAVLASRDGYLWFGTDEGLVRFDGSTLVVFDRTNTPALSDPFVWALHESPDGSLWAGTDRGGLLRRRQEQFTRYGAEQGLPAARIHAIADAGSGAVWVGLREGGLARVEDGGVKLLTTRDGLSSDDVLSVLQDRSGTLWVGTDRGLDRFDGTRFVHAGREQGLPAGGVRALHEDGQGRLWVGTVDGLVGARLTRGGLAVREGDRFRSLLDGAALPSTAIMDIHEAGDGTMWLATAGGGIVRVRGTEIAQWGLARTAADDMVYSLAEDFEGNLWIGTAPGGLHRLSDGVFTTWTIEDGLPDNVVESLYEDRHGAMWVGTHAGGLCRMQDHGLRCLSTRDGLADNRVNAVLDDADGHLWLGTQGGLNVLRHGTIARYGVVDGLPADHVNALARDREGSLWVGTWGGGVARLRPGGAARFESLDGLAGAFVTCILVGKSGEVWIGTTQGLHLWKGGGLADTAAIAFPTGIEALYEDRDGTLWIGTRRDGLYRYASGRLVQYTTRDGLFDNLVGTILEDDAGWFWFTSNKGVSRVLRSDLMADADGSADHVEAGSFDTTDGMPNRECNFGQGRWKSRDGRLWFATVGGVAVIDPSRTAHNLVPPPVHIEEVIVDGEALARAAPAVIGSHGRRLEIRFAAVSLGTPSRVRYRYQLEGFDPDWVEGGGRVVQYTNLAPGEYRFRVTAANGNSAWTVPGASLALRVEGPWWSQPVVLAGSLTGLVLLALAAGWRGKVRWRAEQAKQDAFARQLIAAQERERKRLASELHDGIGQHLLVIGNWTRLSLAALTTPDRARPLLEEIGETTAQALIEVRGITRDLQPYDISRLGLSTALEAMLARLAESSGIAFTWSIDADADLGEEAGINLYRIVQEATNNVVKHSKATAARVELRSGVDVLELTISDNGHGLVSDVSSRATADGFGVRSMTERTRLLGGSHSIHSTPGGCTVRVVVPRPTRGSSHAQ